MIDDSFRVDQGIVTGNYCSGMDRLFNASHFIDRSGVRFKVPQGLKIYYQYRFRQYQNFYESELPYFESVASVSKVLSISIDSINKTYHPLLKKMNLLETFDSSIKDKGYYKFNPLDEVTYNGWLVNDHLKDKERKKKGDRNGIDWQQIKTLEHNKKVAKKTKAIKDQVMTAIPRDEYFKLLEIKRIAEEH